MAPPEPGLSSSQLKGRLRPVHTIGPVAGSIVTLLAWAAIAHNSGSGWVQALGAVLGSVLFIGLVAPARVVKRARVTVTSAPGDATAGEPLLLKVDATTRVRITPVLPEGRKGFFGPAKDESPNAGDPDQPVLAIAPDRELGENSLSIIPERRGILVAVTVEIASAAPFGLLWWSRRVTLALPTEVAVAPRPTHAMWVPPERDDTRGDSNSNRAAAFGEPRGVREYKQGDSRRSVHWRATAHTGRLMVREMESPNAEPVTVRVALSSDPLEADALASRAMATVLALLERSRPVILWTMEPEGERRALVTSSRDAGRRLARAVPSGFGVGSVVVEDPRQGTFR